MLALELVKDRQSKEPLVGGGRRIAQFCIEQGLLIYPGGGHYRNCVAFLPPLLIDRSHVELAVAIVRQALAGIRTK